MAELFSYPSKVERWSVFEIAVNGEEHGNPFTERTITGTFTGVHEKVTVDGFYDGGGIYKIRFMPRYTGGYTFSVTGNYSVKMHKGTFEVEEASMGNHGPVHVANTFHFAYEDGTPYYSIGTTCYVWELQSDDRIRDTFETLRSSPFNKIRFCIMPKHYDYNLGEPRSYPYEGTPMDSSILTKENFSQYTGKKKGNYFDHTRFNPGHFRHIETCIEKLMELGIEADLIVMHPYDRWGFAQMSKEEDDLYWKYVIARFAAYRNVWWSLANEHDLLDQKNTSDWERYASILMEKDPYGHVRSIHNCILLYDHTRPWVSHASVQRVDIYRTVEDTNLFRERYRKPVVWDELGYEGNIQHGWGNLPPQEIVRRFWEASVRGGYAGHSETYLSEDDKIWWSHGGKLHGESWKRLELLHQILCETPGLGLAPNKNQAWDEVSAVPENEPFGYQTHSYYLYYYSFMQPSFRDYYIDDTTDYEVKVIDTWNMTVEHKGIHRGKFRIELPGRQYIAVQLKKV